MSAPNDLKYTPTHEWVRKEEDGTVVVGITEHAQTLLGDIVFIELPEQGQTVEPGQDIAVIESVKAASDLYAPIAGEILEVNETLNSEPGTINQEPYGDGWIFKLQPINIEDCDQLLDAQEYLDKTELEENA